MKVMYMYKNRVTINFNSYVVMNRSYGNGLCLTYNTLPRTRYSVPFKSMGLFPSWSGSITITCNSKSIGPLDVS